MLRILSLSVLFAVASASGASTFDANLSNSAAQFKFGMPSGVAGKSDIYASLMYNDVNSVVVEGGLLVLNEEGHVPGLSIGIGAKGVAASINKIAPSRKIATGVALGGQLRFEVPADRRIAFVGEYYFAPRIISFSNADHYYQGALRAEYAISPLTQAYIGYRTTKFIMLNGLADGVLDNGPHLGIRLSF